MHNTANFVTRWLGCMNAPAWRSPIRLTTRRHAVATTPTQTWHTVIFAQARPGQFSAGDVELVSRRFPLAHYVALLGSLCEGETRSGHPWPGVVRVYWHQFLARCESELRVSLFPTSWQLPRTASDVERTESVFERPQDPASGMIVVFTRNASLFDALSAACQTIGYSCVWCSNQRRRNFHGAVAAIWDGETQGQIDFLQLSRITAELPEVPVIALLGFPRHDQVLQAQAHGARAVVSSPFLLPDLWNAIRAVRGERIEDEGNAWRFRLIRVFVCDMHAGGDVRKRLTGATRMRAY